MFMLFWFGRLWLEHWLGLWFWLRLRHWCFYKADNLGFFFVNRLWLNKVFWLSLNYLFNSRLRLFGNDWSWLDNQFLCEFRRLVHLLWLW